MPLPETKIRIGIIGGSGLYDIEELKNVHEITPETPFGRPSDIIVCGELGGVPVAFLPRHGRGHVHTPTEIPQRANIYALKALGVETLISVSAVGSLREELAPRHMVFPDQLVDKTFLRKSTFFGNGIVAHAVFAHPFCDRLGDMLYKYAVELGITCHRGGTLVTMEGPQFSTKAESLMHRQLGYDLIGMTTAPEAKLAREAQMCFVPVSLVTDYDSWKEGEEVTPGQIVSNLQHNAEAIRNLLVKAVPQIAAAKRDCHCAGMMKGAILTKKELLPPETARKLGPLLEGIL